MKCLIFTCTLSVSAFLEIKPVGNTVAQKTAPMFAYYIKTHVLLNADII